MLTAQPTEKHDADSPLFVTREDVRRYVADRSAASAARQAALVRRQRALQRAGLLSVLCLSLMQYYFLTIGVEILSIPGLTVFVVPARLG